ncbi:MAG: hypothetical protein QM758_23765 [Armatimonas sp.]
MKRNQQRQRGFSAVEMLIGALAFTVTLISVANLNIGVGRAASAYERSNRLSRNTRISLDEGLFRLRGAESIQATQGTMTLGPTTAIFRLPAYNPNTPGFFLDNVYDTIVITYDANNRQILETILPAIGSVRAPRSNWVIAREVTVANFDYYARQNFRALNTGNQTFTLGAPIAAANVTTTTSGTGPNAVVTTTVTGAQAYVNGMPTTFTYNPGNQSITVSCPARGADVQILYPARPDNDGGSSRQLVTQVRLNLTLRNPTDENGTISLQGLALLRNRRD